MKLTRSLAVIATATAGAATVLSGAASAATPPPSAYQVISAALAGHLAPADDPVCHEGGLLSEYNDRYVSTETGYSGSKKNIMRARATTVGDTELYDICVTLVNREVEVTFRSQASGLYATVDGSSSGYFSSALRATASRVGPAETFQALLDPAAKNFQLRSRLNNRYVTNFKRLPGADSMILRAISTTIGAPENFNWS